MEVFNVIDNRLKEKGFEKVCIEEVNNLGSETYKSEVNHVVVTKILVTQQIHEIQNYSNLIRNIIIMEKININNTYLLFCYDFDMKFEVFFSIERDTRNLRKYVVKNSTDLNRIPFLDNTIKENQDLSEIVTGSENSNHLVEIDRLLIENNGFEAKLNQSKISEIFKQYLEILEESYEN